MRSLVLRDGAAAATGIQRSAKNRASRRLLGALIAIQRMALADFTTGFLAEGNESTADASQGLESGAIAVEGRGAMLAAGLAIGGSIASWNELAISNRFL